MKRIHWFTIIAVVVVLVAGGVSGTSLFGANRAETRDDLVITTLAHTQTMPASTQEDLRRRLTVYIAMGQLVEQEMGRRQKFVEISDGLAKHYSGLIKSLATDDARRLYGMNTSQHAGSAFLFMNEDEETSYALWQSMMQLELDCVPITADSGCSVQYFRLEAEHMAQLMITQKGGLLDQMRADPKNRDVARRINHLVMKYGMWNRLALTGEDSIRIATS